VVLIHAKKTMRERWEAVVREFSRKSTYAQADLRAKFMGMQCLERKNPREFLEGLWMKKEEMAQAGVVINKKDYFSVIISSLPVALSNFASNQLAAAQFLLSKSMTPDDLLSMLVEESDCQRAQWQRRQGSGKGEDGDEALAATSSRLRRGQANITCWTCKKVGHYSYECEEPSESDDDAEVEEKASNDDVKSSSENDGTAATAELDDEYGGAWAEEIPVWDWFDEVVEGENESEDEGVSSKGALVEGFGMVASGEPLVVDSDTTDPDWPDFNNVGSTDELSGTLLGTITPVVDLEGEYGGVGHIYRKSSGLGPDLDVFRNPWIEDVTMEWSNHAIALRTSVKVVTRPLEDRKGGDVDSDVQRCDVGVIGVVRLSRNLKGLERDCVVCEVLLLVPHYEGEEDNQCEMTNLPITKGPLALNDPPNYAWKTLHKKVSESSPNVKAIPVSFAKGLETRCDASTTHIVVNRIKNASTTHILRFEPLSAVGIYKEGQGGVESVNGDGGLTLVNTVHLEHPPGNAFMSVKPSTTKIIDPGDFALKTMHKKVEESLPFATNVPAGCVKFFEVAETPQLEWVVLFFVVGHFVPFLAIGTYGKGQVNMKSLYRGCGLTLDKCCPPSLTPWMHFRRKMVVVKLGSFVDRSC